MYTVNWIVFGDLLSKSFSDWDAAHELASALLALGVSYVCIENR